MRKARGKLMLFCCIAMAFATAGCLASCADVSVGESGAGSNSSSSSQTTELKSISITGAPEGAVALSTGSVQLGITYSPSENVGEFSVKWQSNSQAVATVDSNGLVTLIGAGRTTITASVIGRETIKDSVTIDVTKEIVPVTSVTITGRPENDKVASDVQTVQLSYAYAPETADDFAVEWYSSTSSVATIDKTGLVTIVDEGTTTIRLTVKGTEVSDEFVLLVGNTTKVESVEIAGKPENNSLRAGVAFRLSYTYAPENSAYFETEWKSSDTDVATISDSGEIATLKAGTTEITLCVKDTQIEDKFTLTVTPPIDPLWEDFDYASINGSEGSGNYQTFAPNYNGVDLAITSSAEELPAGGSGKALKVSTASASWGGAKLTPKALPKEATTYLFSIDVKLVALDAEKTSIYANVFFNDKKDGVFAPNKIFSVGESGTITGEFTTPDELTAFAFEIFCALDNGGAEKKSVSFTLDNLIVREKPSVSIANRPENDRAYIGGSALTLTADTNVEADVSWTSSATNVAEIGNDGLVTLKSAGTTVITATVEYYGGIYTDSFTLTVVQTGIDIINPPASIKIGEERELVLEFTGEFEGVLKAETSAAGIVEAVLNEADGTLTIIGVGIGEVTVTVSKGDYEKSFTVSVTNPYITTEGFENLTASGTGFTSDVSLQIKTSNSATLSQTSETEKLPEGGSGKALLVSKPGANGSYPGAEIKLNKALTIGAQYEFTATVKSVVGVSQIFMKLEGNNDLATNVKLEVGATTEIKKTITVSQAQPAILLFIVSSADNPLEEFSVDNVTVTELKQIAVTNRPADDTVEKSNGEYLLGYALLGGATAEEVVWTSSAQDVATIDSTGKVTPLSVGSTTITVTAGEYKASFILNVTDPSLAVVASENFDGNFVVSGDSNSGWSGTTADSGVTFSAGGYQMLWSENSAHLPAGGSGKCVFWQPWDGGWAEFSFGADFRPGKKYEIRFKMKVVGHKAGFEGIRFAVKKGTDTIVWKSMGFSAVGETIDYKCVIDLTSYETIESCRPFISVETTSTTQLAIDDFVLYEI